MTLELLQVADAVAREKSIDKEVVIEAMEDAIQMAARRRYGMDLNVQAIIERVDGGITLKRLWEVVEVAMEPVDEDEERMARRENRDMVMKPSKDSLGKAAPQNARQMTLETARKINPAVELGEFINEELPPIEFGRIAAQAAKQVIFQRVKDAERGLEFEEFKDSSGKIVSGTVKRVDHRGVLLDLGQAEGLLARDEMIPRESFRQGDRVKAYIFDVRREMRGPQIFVSRTHPQFMVKLFEEEVPEVGNATIELIGAARDPGFRGKIAVKSADRNIDPVGACVGIRGSRVQAVMNELQGERIDVVQWSADPVEFLVQAISPAEVTKVVLDEQENRMEVIVPEDKLSLAIGKRGQNVRLASILTGFDIDIMTEQEESTKREKEFKGMTDGFIAALDVDETLARLLITEGFNNAEELLMVSLEEVAEIEGLNAEIAEELRNRASNWANAQAEEINSLGLEKELLELDGMRKDVLVSLGKAKVKTRDDLAELATDELLELLPEGLMNQAQAEDMIMAARKHWFEDEGQTA